MPAERSSNSEATMTMRFFFATRPSASVVGPGIGSASFKFSVSSPWGKIARAKKLLQTDDLRAFFRRRRDALLCFFEIGARFIAGTHLHEADGNLSGIFFARHSRLWAPARVCAYFRCCAKKDFVFSHASLAASG